MEATNKLARIFYAMHGHAKPEDYKFQNAKHPQERLMWAMAKLAVDLAQHLAWVSEGYAPSRYEQNETWDVLQGVQSQLLSELNGEENNE